MHGIKREKHSPRLSSPNWFSFTVMFMVVVVVFCLDGYHDARATENGGSAYAGGNEDFMTGALPPPGFYLLNYFNYTKLDSLRDNEGHRSSVDFDGEAVANTFRFLYVSKKRLLGADVIGHFIVPVANVHVSVDLPDGTSATDTKTGLGDIVVSPFALAWHWKNFHCVGGLDFIVPTGAYDKDDLANIGRNYWTFSPVFAFTYVYRTGFEASAKIMYFVNTVNTATHYTSGQEFGIDYLVGHHFGPWSLGVNGYYYRQITNDKSHGDTVRDNKGRLFSVGPALQYSYKNMFFNLKYHWDTNVKNKPDGEHLWFKFMYSF